MTSAALEEMSKSELIETLRVLRADPRLNAFALETERVIHDLQVHQIELEMQNRELREAQQMLEESRARYADLYDLAPIVYCTLDVHGRIQEANLTAAAFFGIERAALTGRLLPTIIAIETPEVFFTHLKTCFRDRLRTSVEVTFTKRDGKSIVTQVVSTPHFDVEGSVKACKTAFSDITQVKRHQERLRFLARTSEILASSFDYLSTLPEVVQLSVPALADLCFLDLIAEPGRLQRVEVAIADPSQQRLVSAVKRLTPQADSRTPQAEVLRTGRPMLLPECLPSSFSTSLAQGPEYELVISACRARSMMFVPLTSRGKTVGVFTLITTDSGRHYGASDLGFAQDLALRMAMAIDNAQLFERAQKAVGAREEILCIVSHDLKNLLNSVMLGSALLLQAAPVPERRKGRKQLEAIRRAGDRMNRMINDLLDVSSIEAGRLSVELQQHDLKELIDDVCETFLPLANEKGVEFVTHGVLGATPAYIDRDRVLQVLSNIIGNAIKFTPRGETVSLRTDVVDNKLRFAVKDSGPGIPPELLSRVFERYTQARETAARGRGLGLYIARGIVETHGGSISVTSKIGEGSTFFVTLPIELPPAEEVRTTKLKALQHVSPTQEDSVLVVDDDAETRDLLKDILEAKDYLVAQASNGAEAIDYLQRHKQRPSLILLDLEMPVMDGQGFMGELRADPELEHIPVVIVSSHIELRSISSDLGVAGYLEKPLRIPRLIEIVEQHKLRGTMPSQHGAFT